MISLERLKDLLEYNPDTGIFTNKTTRLNTVSIGSIAGGLHTSGYRYIRIDGEGFYEHKLVWLYTKGVLPTAYIDHINGIKTDNRFVNLRLATRQQNSYNRKDLPSSTKYRGVSSKGIFFQACITEEGKYIYLGTYNSAEEASIMYERRAKLLHKEFYFDNKYDYGKYKDKEPIPHTLLSSTGTRGVYKKGLKFQSKFKYNGKSIYVGSFDTIEAAQTAYTNKRQEMGLE